MKNSLESIEQTLQFIVEIERLKDIHRKTKPVGLTRYENSAEHSWHVCLSALMLKDYANTPVDIDRVIKMLLIHDLGEIDAGDTIIYESESEEQKGAEEAGLKRILDLLPQGKTDEYLPLWQEFEAGKTADSKFAKAIDRVPPLLHNLHGNGHSWRAHKISPEKIYNVNGRIAEGSVPLWDVLHNRIEKAMEAGLLKS